jgi:hypothetical protein
MSDARSRGYGDLVARLCASRGRLIFFLGSNFFYAVCGFSNYGAFLTGLNWTIGRAFCITSNIGVPLGPGRNRTIATHTDTSGIHGMHRACLQLRYCRWGNAL